MINLDDDGLNLWLAALRNTLTLSSVNGAPAMFDLFPEAVSILSSNLDLLAKLTGIVESYLLLDAPGLLQVSVDGTNVFAPPEYLNQASGSALFQGIVTVLKSESLSLMNTKDLLITLNLLVQISPSGLWGEAMHNSGLFAHILINLIEGEVCSIA